MLVNSYEILSKAREGQYAVGAFNAFDHPTVEAIISAAEEKSVPVIVQVGDWLDPTAPESKSKTVKEATNLWRFIRNRAEAATVPVCIHLDHCKSFEGCMRAIHFGASSVMIDASSLPLEENIAITKKVVEAAHSSNISVEAEIGHVAFEGDGVGDIFTTVDEAVRFYQKTQVDILAVAIGTVHGLYKKEPNLQYDRISELKAAIPAPLVMHGGSGLSVEQYKESITRGISKINIATNLHLAGGNAIKEMALAAGDKSVRYNAFLNAGANAAKQVVLEYIGYFLTEKANH